MFREGIFLEYPDDEVARKWDKSNLPREIEVNVDGFKYRVTLNDDGRAIMMMVELSVLFEQVSVLTSGAKKLRRVLWKKSTIRRQKRYMRH